MYIHVHRYNHQNKDYGLSYHFFLASDLRDRFIIIDWESLVVLPKHVAFKGNNGCYLQGIWQEGHPYLQFSSNDIGDHRVPHQTSMTTNGYVGIKEAGS